MCLCVSKNVKKGIADFKTCAEFVETSPSYHSFKNAFQTSMEGIFYWEIIKTSIFIENISLQVLLLPPLKRPIRRASLLKNYSL